MVLQQRINALGQLGSRLESFVKPYLQREDPLSDWLEEGDPVLLEACRRSSQENGWFVPSNILHALESWSDQLRSVKLEQWMSSYTEGTTQKTVGLVMAGNIPLVGFHDLLSVIITGHRAVVKLSSSDKHLLPALVSVLGKISPELAKSVRFTEDKLQGFDAVIATGSNNTARYFEYYFGKYPHIIRRNRNGVAVLDGAETEEQLRQLSDDIFRYFGLGCRNVSKVFVPQHYSWDAFFSAMYSWKDLINNHKYINNYDYNKAVYLMSDVELLENGFMLLKEDSGYSSPIATVYYEHYHDEAKLLQRLEVDKEHIQCVIGNKHIPFGLAQRPQLADYADGVDTVDFLLKL
jgi:hypothetical protein